MSKNLQVVLFFMLLGGVLVLLMFREFSRSERGAMHESFQEESARPMLPVPVPRDVPLSPAPRAHNQVERERLITSAFQLWNRAHNAHDVDALGPLYASEVDFYGRVLPRDEVVAIKRTLLSQAPDFEQNVSSAALNTALDGTVTARFNKKWMSKGKPGEVQGVLEYRAYGDSVLITKESDSSIESK